MNDESWLFDVFGPRPFPWEREDEGAPGAAGAVSVFDHWLSEKECETIPFVFDCAASRGQQREFVRLAAPLRSWLWSMHEQVGLELIEETDDAVSVRALDRDQVDGLLDAWLKSQSLVSLGIRRLSTVLLCSYDFTIMVYSAGESGVFDHLPDDLYRLS
ncbi:MAG: hypothetical protein ACRBN8_30410 [Nannocystales bacterium]